MTFKAMKWLNEAGGMDETNIAYAIVDDPSTPILHYHVVVKKKTLSTYI